jgi:Putative beta-barrel porin 2
LGARGITTRRDCHFAGLRKPLIALVCAISVLLGVGDKLAAQERERQAPPSAPPAPAAPDAGSAGSVGFFAATQGGFDSNLDNRVASHGSPFEMFQLGANGSYKPTDSSAYSFYLSGRDFWYNDLAVQQRYDVDAAVGARYDFSPETALKIGTSYYKDAISLDRFDYYKSFADLVNEGESYRLRVRLDSHTEVSTNESAFTGIRNKDFDFTKNGSTASLLMMRNLMIAPFIMGNYTDIDYFDQLATSPLDRRAREFWGTTGARVTLNPNFYVDLGVRYNHRDFADQAITHFSSTFYDARMFWRITDGLTLNGVVERQIKEPTTSFGLADDVTTYEVGLEQRIDRWTIRGRFFVDHIEPIGDPLNYYKYNWFLGLGYQLSKNAEVFTEYLGRHVTERVNDATYERARVGAGIRVGF